MSYIKVLQQSKFFLNFQTVAFNLQKLILLKIPTIVNNRC